MGSRGELSSFPPMEMIESLTQGFFRISKLQPAWMLELNMVMLRMKHLTLSKLKFVSTKCVALGSCMLLSAFPSSCAGEQWMRLLCQKFMLSKGIYYEKLLYNELFKRDETAVFCCRVCPKRSLIPMNCEASPWITGESVSMMTLQTL